MRLPHGTFRSNAPPPVRELVHALALPYNQGSLVRVQYRPLGSARVLRQLPAEDRDADAAADREHAAVLVVHRCGQTDEDHHDGRAVGAVHEVLVESAEGVLIETIPVHNGSIGTRGRAFAPPLDGLPGKPAIG